tara:strand:+ start:30 stop:320 length:291 start_codon:yes stop_codon:yes gene_type:complete
MEITQQKTDMIICALIILYTESNEPNITIFEYFNICDAITLILDNVEKIYSKNYMLFIFQKTSNLLDKTLGPLKIDFIKKLIKYGCSTDENGLFLA